MKKLLAMAAALGLAALARAGEPPAEFRLPALYHVGFWVRDIVKARAFYHDYLGYAEPYELRRPNGDLQMVVMKVNERQVIYLFPDASKILPNGDNLDHLGFETDQIEAVRGRLLAQGVKVGTVNRGRIGDLLLGVKDPDGHAFEVTQFAPEGQLLKHQGESLAPGRISDHLRSATLSVASLDAAVRFYRGILGFKATSDGSAPASVRLRFPEGDDFLELVEVARKAGEQPPRAVLEYCLEVPEAEKAAGELKRRAEGGRFPAPSPLSKARDGARQFFLVDPDGTRVVFREPGKSR